MASIPFESARTRARGFEILAFPCNQFGGQEPGSNAEIRQFTSKYGVEFPVVSRMRPCARSFILCNRTD